MKHLFLSILIILSTGFVARTQITSTTLNTLYYIDQLDMCGDTLIVVGAAGELFKSYDYGKTFTQYNNIPVVFNGYCFGFRVLNDKYYYIATRNGAPNYDIKVLKSADFGVSWTPVFERNFISNEFLMVDTTFGILYDAVFDTLWNSVGSDTTWHWHSSLVGSAGIPCFLNYNDSIAIIIKSTAVYRTLDKGQTWTNINGGNSIETLLNGQYVSEDTLFAVAYDAGNQYKSYFLYSHTGGVGFYETRLGFNTETTFYEYRFKAKDVYFINSKIGYLLGKTYYTTYNGDDPSNILVTQDFGQTFEPLYTGHTEQIYKALKVNDSILVMGGENGIILRWNMNQPLPTLASYLNTASNQINQSPIKVYPNPCTAQTTFYFSENTLPVQLTIYNNLGQEILHKTLNTPIYKFNTSTITKGVYFYSANGFKGKLIIN